jgi:hypothetical protein
VDQSVLVPVRDRCEDSERMLDSIGAIMKGLETFEDRERPSRSTSKLLRGAARIVRSSRHYRKVCPSRIVLSRLPADKLIDDVVQRRAGIARPVADDQPEHSRRLDVGRRDPPDSPEAVALRFVALNDFDGIALEVLAGRDFECIQMFSGAMELGTRTVKRMRHLVRS